MSTSSGADAGVVEYVHRDLLTLATWRVIRGRADEPLVRVEIEDGSPEDAQEAAVRLNAITARDLARIRQAFVITRRSSGGEDAERARVTP
ncbi:MAG TPA: hypothetical protein VD903_18020 [Pseudonocardia sp.]|nr:hypothetical protein [Pseudonocardia sp.]